jgi:hypothetical protein
MQMAAAVAAAKTHGVGAGAPMFQPPSAYGSYPGSPMAAAAAR